MNLVFSFRAACAALAATAAACVGTPVQVRETSGNSLPPGLELPALWGDVNAVADRICDWAAASQIPFPPLDSVTLVRVEGADGGRYAAEGVLTVFLQRELPRELTLALDPAKLIGHGTEARRVNELIGQPGWWTLTKLDSAECATSQAGRVAARYGELTLCVEARRVDAPLADGVEAEYRDLRFRLSVGVMQQPAHIQVMTVLEDGRVIGRSLRVNFWAGPADIGRINRTCEPAPVVVAFESAGEQQ